MFPDTQQENMSYTDDQEDLLLEIKNNLREARIHLAKWRVQARQNFDFFAGNQWDEQDLLELNKQRKPPVTFNRVARVINAVSGLELQNRQEVRFIPRLVDPNQIGVTELLTGAAKWVRDNCDAEDEESEHFADALICGMGWTETRMDYEQDADGMIIIDRIDPLEMGYDPSAKKRNLADARYIFRVKEYTKKEFMKNWPQFADMINNSSFWNDLEGTPHDHDEAFFYRNDQSDKLNKIGVINVIQYQYWKTVPNYRVLDTTGKIIDLDQDKFAKLQPFIQQNNMQYIQQKKRQYCQVFLCGDQILEHIVLDCDDFTFQCTTGLRDRNNNTWFGLVDLMRDPQRWANKWMSQILHIINTNAKGGLLVESGAFQNPRDAEDDWAKADSIIHLNDGGLGKIQQKEPPPYPEGLDRIMNYAVGAVNDVVGVSIEMLGQANRNQPGYLEEMRKTSSISLLATFFSALRYYRKRQGRVLAEYIKCYIADGRLIRVVGDQGAQYTPLVRDKMTYEYDVIVDDAPSSPNMKERVFGTLVQIIPMLLQAGIPIPPDVVDYSPLPESLTQKWKQMLAPDPQKQQMQQELQQINLIMAQLELQNKQVDIQNKQAQNQELISQTQLNYAKAEQSQALAQDESAQAAMKNDLLLAEHGMAVNQVYQDQQRKDLQMMLEQRRKLLQTLLAANVQREAAKNKAMIQ